MPVGAGSIKRAAKTATTKPEIEKTESVKPEAQNAEAKPTAESPQKKSTVAAKTNVKTKIKTKVKTKKTTKQPKTESTASKQASDPKHLGNQIYHITDELPVHLL